MFFEWNQWRTQELCSEGTNEGFNQIFKECSCQEEFHLALNSSPLNLQGTLEMQDYADFHILSKYCPGDKMLEGPPITRENMDEGEGIDDLQRWYYIGGATGFATGFWMVCIALCVNRRVRHAFFHFMVSLENWVVGALVSVLCLYSVMM
ncbi:hypothetical protein HanRHA438_Chr02g0095541 [Helianthus annuus]|nr:hypothetical protein HanRHA438_Chr02g0095541 [Helianthus annuus]